MFGSIKKELREQYFSQLKILFKIFLSFKKLFSAIFFFFFFKNNTISAENVFQLIFLVALIF